MSNVLNMDLAKQVAGIDKPRSFSLDASVLENRDVYTVMLDDTKRNKIEFVFPDGVNQLDLFEECRALQKIDDFDVMFDLAMQMLENRDVEIMYRFDGGEKRRLCRFHVTDKYQDLRGIEEIDKWPYLITWLTEFIGGMLLKKCPMPGTEQPPRQASEQ